MMKIRVTISVWIVITVALYYYIIIKIKFFNYVKQITNTYLNNLITIGMYTKTNGELFFLNSQKSYFNEDSFTEIVNKP